MCSSRALLVSCVLFSGAGVAATAAEEPACRFVEIDLPDGWSTMQRSPILSRVTYCSPKELTAEHFSGISTDLDLILSIQMVELLPESLDKAPRDFAENHFLLKLSEYHKAEVPMGMGEVEPRTIDGIEGFVCIFDREEGTQDWTFVGRRDIYGYVVNFTYNVERHQDEMQQGMRAIESLRLPIPAFDGPTRQHVTEDGDFAVTLPADWHAVRSADGTNSTWYVTREEQQNGVLNFRVGLEIMKWPDYSHDAPADLSGTDEKSRDGWLAAQFAVRKDGLTQRTIIGMDETVVDDISCRRLELSIAPTPDAPATHYVHVIGAKEDTLVHARFVCPESEWPYYRNVIREAEQSLRFIVGHRAIGPWIPNRISGRHGDALLLADRLDPHLPDGFVPVQDPAPGSAAGWESDESHQRLMLKVKSDADAHEFAANWRDQLPEGTPAQEESVRRLDDDCSEAIFRVTRRDGSLLLMWMRTANAGEGRMFWLLATLDDNADWRAALAPVFDAFVEQHPTVRVAAGNRFVMSLPGVNLQLDAPKGFTPSFERCRQVVDFECEEGHVCLAVQVPEEERSHAWKNVATEDLMESLARPREIEELTNRSRPRAKDKRDRDRIYLLTLPDGKREWVREQTFHSSGLVCTLRVSFVAEDKRSEAAAARRSAPIFTSFKILEARRRG